MKPFRTLVRLWAPLLVCLLSLGLRAQGDADEFVGRSTVGILGTVEGIWLPGPELEPIERAVDAALIVEIVQVYPRDDANIYDFEFIGLEPGTFDLVQALQRIDGVEMEAMPEVMVEVASVLPPGQVEPSAVGAQEVEGLGGYRRFLWTIGIVWGVGVLLFAGLFVWRRSQRPSRVDHSVRESLADKLRPQIQAAIDGALTDAGLAELERMLTTYWVRRLGLGEADTVTAHRRIRAHAQAGPLMRKLEEWLHSPTRDDDIDLAQLLEPYRDLPADQQEFTKLSGGGGR